MLKCPLWWLKKLAGLLSSGKVDDEQAWLNVDSKPVNLIKGINNVEYYFCVLYYNVINNFSAIKNKFHA